MMKELIKLKLKTDCISDSKSNEIVDAFINACCRLDPSLFEPYMDEEDVFEDKDKWEFMTDFRNKLWNLENVPGEKLYVQLGRCLGCKCSTKDETHEFYDINGKFYFAYLFEKKDGDVTDIYECYISSGYRNSKTIPEWYGK